MAISNQQEKHSARYKEKVKALEGEVKQKMNIGPNDFLTDHGDNVVNEVLVAFDQKYIELVSSGKYGPSEAAEAASGYATDLLNSNKGKYLFHASGKIKFPNIQGNAQQRASAESKAISVSQEMAYIRKLNRDDVSRQGSIVTSKDEMLQVLDKFSKTGRILHPGIVYFSRLYDENALNVLKRQALSLIHI